MGMACGWGGGDKEHIHDLGGETSLETPTWKTENEMKYKIKIRINLVETDYVYRKYRHLKMASDVELW